MGFDNMETEPNNNIEGSNAVQEIVGDAQSVAMDESQDAVDEHVIDDDYISPDARLTLAPHESEDKSDKKRNKSVKLRFEVGAQNYIGDIGGGKVVESTTDNAHARLGKRPRKDPRAEEANEVTDDVIEL